MGGGKAQGGKQTYMSKTEGEEEGQEEDIRKRKEGKT